MKVFDSITYTTYTTGNMGNIISLTSFLVKDKIDRINLTPPQNWEAMSAFVGLPSSNVFSVNIYKYVPLIDKRNLPSAQNLDAMWASKGFPSVGCRGLFVELFDMNIQNLLMLF